MSEQRGQKDPPTTCRHCQREILSTDVRPRYVPPHYDTADPGYDDPDGGCVHCTPPAPEVKP